jgi:hypothetical protein
MKLQYTAALLIALGTTQAATTVTFAKGEPRESLKELGTYPQMTNAPSFRETRCPTAIRVVTRAGQNPSRSLSPELSRLRNSALSNLTTMTVTGPASGRM